jgi:hypothetical protein
LALYVKRMKIEFCFRDPTSLLRIDKVMNLPQQNAGYGHADLCHQCDG